MIELITTSDGSHSLLNTDLNETYHSVHGAVRESVHVFIHNGLDVLLSRGGEQSIRIFEVGFGTGLNALLTLQRVLDNGNHRVDYTSIEAFPLEESIWSKLNYAETMGLKDQFEMLHRAAWTSSESIVPNFTLTKLKTTLQEIQLPPASFDLIYFDAFAPSKQPEMWTLPMLRKVFDAMKPGAVFVTYCAKGQLKRDLASLGLAVETLPGPPGKKEMVRATLA